MITTELLKATKVVLVDGDGKSIFFVYGHSAKAIAEMLNRLADGATGAGVTSIPKRRGRKPKEVEAVSVAA